MKKENLLISFSGGRTSAYMLYWIMFEWSDRNNYNIIVVFANTGLEDEETLKFVHKCEEVWNIPIVWVEGKYKDENGNPYSDKGWSVRHKIVNYLTASRNGEPFEEVISLLGIPSTEAPFCSYQLKRYVIEDYLKSIGFNNFYKAIGIRADETKRMTKGWFKNKIIYPLATINKVDKKFILNWWGKQTFDLQTIKDLGNCNNCWKKDMKILTRNARLRPHTFDWWKSMQDKYGYFNPRGVELTPPFNFYRGNVSVQDIFNLSKLEDRQLDLFMRKENFNKCTESCEAF